MNFALFLRHLTPTVSKSFLAQTSIFQEKRWAIACLEAIAREMSLDLTMLALSEISITDLILTADTARRSWKDHLSIVSTIPAQ